MFGETTLGSACSALSGPGQLAIIDWAVSCKANSTGKYQGIHLWAEAQQKVGKSEDILFFVLAESKLGP